MKRFLLAFILGLSLLFPLAADHRIQITGDNALSTVVAQAPDSVEWFGMELPPPFFLKDLCLGYQYQFNSDSNFHWLLGVDLELMLAPPYAFLTGGFINTLVQKDNFAMDVMVNTKLGLWFPLYNQISVDLVFSRNKEHCFYYGAGIFNTFYGWWGDVITEADGVKTESFDYKLIDHTGIRLFVGYKF